LAISEVAAAFKSSNPDVAAVDSAGVALGRKAGAAVIRVELAGNTAEATLLVIDGAGKRKRKTRTHLRLISFVLRSVMRCPAVAGMFYESRPDRLEQDVRRHLGSDGAAAAQPAFGAVVPHAGYVYSGPVAGAVYARLEIPASVVILCPNHTGRGAPAALDPSDAWRTPLGEIPVDRRLADRLRPWLPPSRTRRRTAEHPRM
jgi:hypothetical protein